MNFSRRPVHRAAIAFSLTATLALAIVGCREPDGEDREPAAGGGSITVWTDRTELFMEHPELVVGAPAKLLVHLTALSDFSPVSGKITLRFEPLEGGEGFELAQEVPRSPGIYGPAPVFPRPGAWKLRLTIESPQVQDAIELPELRVRESDADAPPRGDEPDEGIAFLKEQQWKAPGFQTAFAELGEVASGFDAPGEVVPAAGRYAEVTAPIAGLVEAKGVADSPAPGEKVAQGEILAVLTPTLGESGSSFAAARAELRTAEQEFERAERLLAVEAIPERRVQEARIRLAAAREALSGLAGGASFSQEGKLPIRSPITGVVARRELTPGSRVDAGSLLFAVVDPSLVWLRVHVPATQASSLTPAARATFRLEGTERVYESVRTVAVGSVVDPASRTLPALFEVENPDRSIKVGAHARVFLRTGDTERGVTIPDSALLEEDGRPVAYVQAGGERFERRELTLGPREGGRVLVREGIRAGERVVTGAAYQIRLASLSTSVPAHGHEH